MVAFSLYGVAFVLTVNSILLVLSDNKSASLIAFNSRSDVSDNTASFVLLMSAALAALIARHETKSIKQINKLLLSFVIKPPISFIVCNHLSV